MTNDKSELLRAVKMNVKDTVTFTDTALWNNLVLQHLLLDYMYNL